MGGEGFEDGAGPWVKTISRSGCRTDDVLEDLYGDRGKWGRWEPREGICDAGPVSKVGSEATVGSVLDVRDDILSLCVCDSGKLFDEYPREG